MKVEEVLIIVDNMRKRFKMTTLELSALRTLEEYYRYHMLKKR